jgi:hypothetical protein
VIRRALVRLVLLLDLVGDGGVVAVFVLIMIRRQEERIAVKRVLGLVCVGCLVVLCLSRLLAASSIKGYNVLGLDAGGELDTSAPILDEPCNPLS